MTDQLNDRDGGLRNPWKPIKENASHPYRDWLIALFCWDGVLPFFILSVVTLIPMLFPKQDGVQVAANVLIPIAAFFWRAAIGGRHFDEGRQFGWQALLFFLGICFLILVDTFFIICHMNRNQISPDEWRVLVNMYLIYLAVMAISLFPFRVGTTDNGIELDQECEDF